VSDDIRSVVKEHHPLALDLRWSWNHSADEIRNGLDPGAVGTHRIGTAAAKLDKRSRRHGGGKI
jgi:hypothetical protein